jgi:prepilin-type N-terminal cleavage/methylation domain-containing protein
MEYSERGTILQALIIRLVVSEKGDVEMKIIAKGFLHKLGFTLVEMLMAIAIIAVLVSLIIPALSLVHKSADMVRQKSQFHSIGVGLEAFSADFGDYPESDRDEFITSYPGAQKLAEAVIGHDGFGFHSDSIFDRAGEDENGIPLYKPEVDEYIDDNFPADERESERRKNLAMRKGPYLELETANAVKLNNIYNGTPFMPGDRYVLTDMFGLVKNKATGKKTGMPILYYKANTSNLVHDPCHYSDDPYDNIYNYLDNDGIVLRENFWDDREISNPMASDNPSPNGPRIFYENTLNPNFDNPLRPYRSDSFILLSAGPDGLYGTVDDVFNFERAE